MKHRQMTDELQEQASLYAVGAMTQVERLEYARHLEVDECAVCRAEVADLEFAAHGLSLTLPLHIPSPSVRTRLIAQVQSTAVRDSDRESRRRYIEWAAWLVAAGSLAALVALLMLNANLRQQIGSLTTRVIELETQIVQQRTALASLTSPQLRILNLSGQGATPQAAARIFWDQSRQRWWFYASGLPPASPDRSYQLWFVPQTGNPVSAQVFNTNPDGTAGIEMPAPQDITSFQAAAVTTEPAGGLPQPSGPFVLSGTLE